jgi:hypothetical protein
VASGATDLSFFESRPTPPLPDPTPERTREPQDVTPGVVAVEVMLSRTTTAAVAVGRLRVYPSGFALPLLVRLVDPPCVFRSNPISRFGRIRSPISLESDRAFRSNPITSVVGGAVA